MSLLAKRDTGCQTNDKFFVLIKCLFVAYYNNIKYI